MDNYKVIKHIHLTIMYTTKTATNFLFVFCSTRRGPVGPDGISLHGALEAGGP